MKILVTGGAGYIGSHSVKHLLKHGHEVVVLDNLSRGHKWAVRWGKLEHVDLLDLQALQEVFSCHKPQAVMHFAALALVGESVTEPMLYYRNNFVGSLNLMQAMLAAEVEVLVFSSTCAVYGHPQAPVIDEMHPQLPVNPYGWSKLMTERAMADLAQAYGLRTCALRYFNAAGCDAQGEIGEVHEPETHLIPSLLRSAHEQEFFQIYGDDYPTPDGTCIRDYVHVEDLALAHRLALEKLVNREKIQSAYNLGTGQGHSVRQVIEVVEKVTQHKIGVKISPRRLGDPAVLVANATRANLDLGWQPQWLNLEATVASAWDWYRSWKNLALT